MRLRISHAMVVTAIGALAVTARDARSQSGIAAPPQQAAPASTDARFAGLAENKERLRVVYEKLDAESMADIDKLIRTKRCNSLKVNGLLDRLGEALNLWNEAELKYWTVWADAEEERVNSQKKSLASMEAETQRANELVVSTTKDREDLIRQKANLEKNGGTRSAAINQKIDALVLDIKETETRLADAQKNYEEVTSKVTGINASLTTRLVEMRQNKRTVEAYGLDMSSYYQSVRATEQEICSASQPDSTKQLPKSQPKKP